MMIGNCSACGNAVIWAWTPRRTVLALDPTPQPDGTLILNATGGLFSVAPAARSTTPGSRYRRHDASCPAVSRTPA